jgi:hypothetical protein
MEAKLQIIIVPELSEQAISCDWFYDGHKRSEIFGLSCNYYYLRIFRGRAIGVQRQAATLCRRWNEVLSDGVALCLFGLQ